MKIVVMTSEGVTYTMTGPRVRSFHGFSYLTLSNGQDKIKIPRKLIRSIAKSK